MTVETFTLPDPGEGLTEAEIVTWNVAPGDTVKVNDVVVEIETSKSLVELPIPWAGTVVDLLVPAGSEVPVGTPIITIDTGGGSGGSGSSASSAVSSVAAAAPATDGSAGEVGAATDADGWAGAPASTGGDAPKREPNLVGYGAIAAATTRRPRKRPGGQGGSGPSSGSAGAPAVGPPQPAASAASAGPASGAPAAPPERPSSDPGEPQSARPLTKPPIRRYCRDRGIDLTMVRGTGPDGVITWEDVDAHVAGHGDSGAAFSGGSATAPRRGGEREVRVPVKGVRKHTAAAMSSSAFTAPHVTEFVTVDVSASMELVERLKADKEFADVKVSPLLLVAKAVLLACRRHPGVNAVWESGADGDVIVEKNYVNLGIAAATPRGLVVPNIKDAHAMNLRELAGALGDLTSTARAGRTQPTDMTGGTITITNVGVFGVDSGTPIINPGESAILCFGAVRRMPWVVGSGADERIEPRWVTQLALSFDHRLVDGDLGSRFLADVAAVLADPAKGLVWG